MTKPVPNISVDQRRYQRVSASIFVVLFFFFEVTSIVYAAEKTWSGSGDGTSWTDADNWYAEGIPALSDDVAIDAEDASVTCGATFKAKSITMGGRETSTLTVADFIYGTVTPSSTSDTAILNRSGGTIILNKVGTLTLHGGYQDSEGTLTSEPSFLFWLE